ncbi:DNA cytosine methyltransferase [Selenomonas caprae]|uniref:DNA (cytosine-5-)-methyltransferase n=1 Tax=Selenomonas caprae TaxID=2606905 RepID=A0A5D6WI29_9FIRM|nr:DNA cytosine methyltransferase [Selenomonas caprae]TYZ27122.1 DNA cytosine methyltransferase [Selenomonas caprae]
MTEQKKLTLGSLFDGSGGFPLGAILAGIEPRWASEVEPFPIRVTTKRLPMVKHYGDINQIHGGKVEPVDIITFGSPCTDMSIAGKRAGLDGKQSCLFYEAVRVIKEMREATNGRYPRFIVWENVTGAFSSSKGRDFQSVLTEIVRIKEPQAPPVPMPEKTGWPYADILMGDGWSIAYRVMDAQGWGVPQRRRRIYLVADFAGGCASKILFDTESLLGDFASCFSSWQGFAGKLAPGLGTAGKGVSVGFCTEHSAKSRSIGYEEEKSPTLRAGVVPAAITTQQAQVYENHSMDSRYTGPLDVAPTVASTYGTGGNNQPLVTKFWDGSEVAGTITASNAAGQQRMPDKDNFNAVVSTIDIRLTSEGTKNARHNIYETNISRCIDTSGNTPDANQGGLAIVQQDEAYAMTTGCYTQVEKEKSPTLMSRDYKDPTAVCCGIGRDAFNSGANAKFAPSIDEELQPPMTARGPGAVQKGYIVRRLTPLECCRLQGFPDWWCSDLGTENPTAEEMQFWREVFETHRKVMGTTKKSKTDNQIRKWLANPHTDSAEYKMWGNGVALPCVYYVMMGIAHFAKET